jgi:chromosome segregation ATPase
MEAKIAALEAQVALLLAERDASKAALADAQEDCASLRLMYSAQKAEVFGVREALDRVTKELKNDALLPLARLREETQQLRHEGFELKSQMGVFERELNAVSAA